MFKPMTCEADLPKVLEERQFEHQTFDAKKEIATSGPGWSHEPAKDVAAFANSEGGTLLVGAFEDKKCGVVTKYFPMPDEQAGEVRNAYSRAVGDRCHPPPLIAPEVIPVEDKGFVVAVNVYPFPLQPVAVRVKTDKKLEGHGDDAYVFPLRVGVDTIYLEPEQLGMFMEPKIRRVALLLESIPEGERAAVVILGPTGHQETRSLIKVDALGARVIFGPLPGEHSGSLVVPFDLARSVCRLEDGWWYVATEGTWREFTRDSGHFVAIPRA